jgi:multisubunit Na+/H+ antiporter MnhG subunit
MSKKTIGILIAIFGALIFFSNVENAWIVSATLLGIGSGVFFWKE